MNNWLIVLIFSCFYCFCFSQSKKDLQLQVDSLVIQVNKIEESKKYLEGEIKNLQLNLSNITTTMGFVSKSNLDLEAQVKIQTAQIQKLISQNDSLLRVFGASGEAKFVISPTNEADSIIYVIQNYYKAKKWDDKLIYVLNPESVKPLMASAYKDEYKAYSYEKSQINIASSNYALGKTFKVFVDGKSIYITKTNDGFKIDWEATYGYNPTSFAVFNSEKSTKPTVFRAEIYLDDYYIEGVGLSKTYYVSMRESEFGACWMPANISGELKKLLADGKKHQVFLEAQYRTFSDDYSSIEKIVITKFIKDGWDK